MTDESDRAGFEALTQSGADDDEDAARSLAAALKAEPDPGQLKAIAALWLHAAAAAPERLAPIYDGAAEGWIGERVGGPPIRSVAGLPPALIPPAFWNVLWALVAEAGGLGSTTRGAAALGDLLSPELAQRAKRIGDAFPAGSAMAPSLPFDAKALGRCPPGSLGAAFLGLSAGAIGPSMRTRDFWRLTAGYQATTLHEAAFTAFQLAQTGHPAPAKILAVMLTRVAYQQPAGGAILLPAILMAWTHGRRTPPLHAVRWDKLWDKSLDEVRAQLGVKVYVSPFPPNLFEQAVVKL